MDSVSTENLKYVAENIEFEEMEVSDVDEALLMALLDESNEEETEDERLGSVMRSLEAEINNINHEYHHPEMIMGSSSPCSSISIEDYRLEDVELDGEDCSISSGSPSHADNYFDWINDMEMDSSLVSSCDDHEMLMNCWYMDTFSNEVEAAGMIEFGDLRDCYEYSNNSLWQGTY